MFSVTYETKIQIIKQKCVVSRYKFYLTLDVINCSTGFKVSAFGINQESFSITQCGADEVCSDIRGNVKLIAPSVPIDISGKN